MRRSFASVGTTVAALLALVRVVLLWRGEDEALKPLSYEQG